MTKDTSTRKVGTITVDLRTVGGKQVSDALSARNIDVMHGALVHRLEKPAADIRASLNDKHTTQLIAAAQLFVEAGHILDLAKKQFFYNKEQRDLQTDAGFLAQCDTSEEYGLRDDSNTTLNKLHHVVGIAGEASELLDGVLKGLLYVRGDSIVIGEVDRVNEVEELGDLEFYLRGFRDATGITRDEVLMANITKLDKRYGDGSYSDQQAIARADKVDNAEPSKEELEEDKELHKRAEASLIEGGATFTLDLSTGKGSPVPVGYLPPKGMEPYKASTYKEVFRVLGDCWKRGCDGQDIVFAAAQWIRDTLSDENDEATQNRVIALIGAKLD